MIRGTTPTIKLTYKNSSGETVDLSSYTVNVTLQDASGTQINVKNSRITFNSDYSFQFDLTQTETLSFIGNSIDVQLKAKDTSDKVIASDIVNVALTSVLYEEEI